STWVPVMSAIVARGCDSRVGDARVDGPEETHRNPPTGRPERNEDLTGRNRWVDARRVASQLRSGRLSSPVTTVAEEAGHGARVRPMGAIGSGGSHGVASS